ncbi:MAG TPA: ABC transporter ATP-binding protein [Pseudonocardiaceae bacterium]|jgi:ABC-type multidrug transport system ATPase subunit|nr:ABC transporter ATP-binding protein [Pseudonocardiaceae bacterium]
MLLRGIGKRYGDGPWVLSGVDLDLTAGEVVAVVGTNGAGKSTLLRLLVGLSRPTVGDIRGRPASIGYVPDRFPPHERMSARAYLIHMGRIRGLRTEPAARRADELIERLALVGGAGTSVRRLSKGNAQKIVLAQALLVPPDLLVLDEPWSGLDTATHTVLAELVAEVGHAGGSVVFTDHREAIAAAYSHRMLRIAGGRVSAHEAVGVTIELRPVGDAPVTLAGHPGVTEVRERQDAVVVLVADEQRDALLRTALAGGWSVLSVRR